MTFTPLPRDLLAFCVGISLTVVGELTMPHDAFSANLVVDSTSSNSSDSGVGNEAQPLRTIGAAMKRLKPGDHVFIAAGVYREPILFPRQSWANAAETVIEGDPKNRTLISGSKIISSWREAGDGRFTTPIGYEPEQVYVDGVPLKQISGTVFGGYPDLPNHPLAPAFAGSAGGIWPGRVVGDRASLPVNSFHYDKALGDVMIRLSMNSLSGHVVEVSALQRLVLAWGVERIVLKNLSFEHSNTTATTRGAAVLLEGNNIRIENVDIRRADGACLGLIGTGHEIRSSSVTECGQLGMGGWGSGWKIIDVLASHNNTRGFNKNWEAGGAKFVGNGGLANATVSGFKAVENFGDGLWFDYNNHDNRITNSLFAFNSGFGLHVEVSKSFLIDHNILLGNRQRGMYLRQTSDSTIAFNLISGNGGDGVAIISEGEGIAARNNWVGGNVIAWNQIALTFPQPVADNQSDGNAFIGDATANSVRISWGKTVPRTDWIARAFDGSSEWLDLPKNQTLKLDPSISIEDQLKWYRTAKGTLRPLTERVRRALKERATALEIGADTRPGP